MDEVMDMSDDDPYGNDSDGDPDYEEAANENDESDEDDEPDEPARKNRKIGEGMYKK